MTELAEGYILKEGADAVSAHAILTESYWAKGISLDTVKRSFENSLTVSIWREGGQVAMARVISDYATFAYLQDVYVVDDHQKRGLSKVLLEWLLAHPKLQGLGRWALYTKDAQAFYAQFGWREYPWPERMMIIDPKVFPK